jgi:predicted alpha/beta superfamily hydrolase
MKTQNSQEILVSNSIKEPIFIASNLNNWKPDDTNFQLKYENGFHKITLENFPDKLQFKFTRGSWETEEVNSFGGAIENRILSKSDEIVYLKIESWKDKFQEIQAKLNEVDVCIWQENMFMPQLNRHRKIWVYLPPNYAENTQKYPVLYMHDAQNLFGEADSPYQKWEVGRTLNKIFYETNWACILVGIEHGEENRLSEYSPFPNPNHGGGEGVEYLKFLVETLKPQVDSHFRTLPEAENTLMIGSSMGGLISIYAALNHGNIFGKVAAFSPSLWWSDDIYALAAGTPYNFVHKMVLLGGEKESDEMLPDLLAMYNTLADNGYFEEKIHLDFYQDGTHTESFWGREFEKAIRWLMSEKMPLMQEEKIIEFDKNNENIRILKPFQKAELINPYGKVIYKIENSEQNYIPIQPLWKGLHALKCFLPNQRIEVKKVNL